ncbi:MULTISPECIES: hypothetical protein [unclassified Nocardia]|uniref:hypothetical protein n=1 Tax=Nocardia sp. NPDC051900 TaxID=3364326 RepID=UPI0037AC1984
MNWERLPGETVEEFVAALLLLKYPRGNLITPSRGDRGIDIRIPAPDNRFDVYQVKRYTRAPDSRQRASIEDSWRAFVSQTLPRLPVRSWTLVMPWDPTNERWEWLQALTAGAGLEETHWMGRTNLDTLAADCSQLVDYYFGDGRRRTEELVSQALTAGMALPNAIGQDLLSAIGERQRALAMALDEIDPFYRYSSEVRPGRLGPPDAPDFDLMEGAGGACAVIASEFGDSFIWVVRVYPRSQALMDLRPPPTTSVTFSVRPGSREHDALRRFITFGVAPEIALPARVTRSEGPSGVTPPVGEVLLHIGAPVAVGGASGLDLELRIEPSRHCIELVNVQQTHGLHGEGIRVIGRDRAGAIEVEFLFDPAAGTSEVGITPREVGGTPPRLVAPVLRAMESLFDGSSALVLATAGGPPLAAPWDVGADQALVEKSRTWAKLAEALIELQTRTSTPLSMPRRVNSAQYNRIIDAAALFRGEDLVDDWEGVDMHVTDPEAVANHNGDDEFAMMVVRPITIDYDGRTIEFDDQFLTHSPTVRFEDASVVSAGVQPGDIVRLLPGSDRHITRRLLSRTGDARAVGDT